MSEEEYINSDNDPTSVETITEDNSIAISEDKEEIEFEEVFKSIQTKITNLSNHDHMMNEKVLDFLRKGGFRK